MRLATTVSLACAGPAGVALIAASYGQAGRTDGNWFYVTFWAGMLVFLVPAGATLLHASTGRTARCALVVLVGLFTSVPKYLFNPTAPRYYDELAHWRQAEDVVTGGRLFAPNGIVSIVEHFPGLESVTATIHLFTGLPVWTCAILVVTIAHVLTTLGVFLLVEALFGDRAGATAVLIYGLNPSFVHFDLQFSYESLAIGLVVWALVGVARLHDAATAGERWAWGAITALLGMACVVTHHLSALFLTSMLLAVTMATIVRARRDRGYRAVATTALAVVLAVSGTFEAWLVLVVPETVSYLSPFLNEGVGQLSALLRPGDGGSTDAGRTLFGGAVVPAYERWAALVAPSLLLLLALAGLRWYHRHHERQPVAIGLALIGLLYFVTLPLLLTAQGAQGVHRSWAFTFVGLAVLIAPGVVALLEHVRPQGWFRRAVAVVALAGLFVPLAVGGVAAGVAEDYRFPRPYEYGHDVRNLTPELLAVAEWIGDDRPLTRIATDMYTRGVTDAFAGTDPSARYRKIPTWELFEPNEPNVHILAALRHYDYEFIVVDKRLDSGQAPDGAVDGYFHAHEPRPGGEPLVISAWALRKFDSYPWAIKVYESTHYRIYRLALPAPGLDR